MKAVLYKGPEVVEVDEVESPSIGSDDVLVRVKAAGICGSDLETYKGKRTVKIPIIIGHEASGDVVEVGSHVSKVAVKDRVTIEPNMGCGRCVYCMTGKSNICPNKISLGINAEGVFAEYVKVPENYVWKIPKDMSYHDAALVEPLAVSVHALKKMEIMAGDNALVIGGGPIGALAALILQSLHANVALQEPVPSRMRILRDLGLKVWGTSPSDIEDLMGTCFAGEKASVIIDAVGIEASLSQALRVVKPGGRIILIGFGAPEGKINLPQIVRQEIEIRGSIIYVADFPKAIKFIHDGIVPASKIVTHKFSLNDIQKGFDVALRGEGLKVLVTV